jgi:aspartate carbamoyltransferase catalytic subunit
MLRELRLKNILHTKQFTREDLETIFETAKDMEKILEFKSEGNLLR